MNTRSPPVINRSRAACAAYSKPKALQAFTIKSTAVAAMTFASNAVSTTGGDGNQFDLAPDIRDGITLLTGQICTIPVLFSPSSTSAKQASLRIETDAPATPHLLALIGTAVKPATAYAPGLLPWIGRHD